MANFEGSASDEFHMSAVKYGIYDITADTRNIDVDSLESVISFINDEVPAKMAEYSQLCVWEYRTKCRSRTIL